MPGTNALITSGTELDAGYCSVALRIIRRQLAKAGVRVAWMLNQILSNSGSAHALSDPLETQLKQRFCHVPDFVPP